MKRIALALLIVTILSQYCQAAKLADSPDGKWSIQTTTQGSVAIFSSAGDPVIAIDRGTTGSERLRAKWSGDSKSVILLDQAPLGSGISGAWFDGARWHATVESDSDLNQAKALAKSQVVSGEVKAEDRELGDWLSRDTIQIRGSLRYLGGEKFSYSYDLQIVPGSYALNRGGFETGGLKASNFQAR